ncbi:MAG: hypothetical protein EZS28_028453, partial [Streblomastix strix]
SKDYARPLQEWVCEVVDSLIDKNKEAVEIGFETDIVLELQTLIGTQLTLQEVKFIHINALKLFTTYGSIERKKEMFEKGIMQNIIRILKSTDVTVTEKTVALISNIVRNAREISEKPQINPYLDQLQKDGIITALYQDGLLAGGNDLIKTMVSECIGQLYNTTPLPEEMKETVVQSLKTGIEIGIRDKDSLNIYFSLLALSCLAWNIANHDEIVKGNPIAWTDEILKINDSVIKEGLSLPKIRELTHRTDFYVKKSSYMLLSWISSRNEMILFEQIKQEICGKTKEEKTILARTGFMEDIITVLKEGKNQIEDKGGLVILAINVAQDLIRMNQQLVQLELDDGEFFDDLFQFYQELQPDQIYNDFVFILVSLADATSDLQKLAMKKIDFINPFIHLLQCTDEDSLIYIILHVTVTLTQMKENGQIKQQDEFLEVMKENGGLDRLIQIAQNDKIQRKGIKQYAAITIASLHKAMKLPDEFRVTIVDSLKQMSNDKNKVFIFLSALALSRIAECEDNHTDIISGDFETALKNYIQIIDIGVNDYGIMLALNLLQFGSKETQNKVGNGVPWQDLYDIILDVTDESILQSAILLDQWKLAIS